MEIRDKAGDKFIYKMYQIKSQYHKRMMGKYKCFKVHVVSKMIQNTYFIASIKIYQNLCLHFPGISKIQKTSFHVWSLEKIHLRDSREPWENQHSSIFFTKATHKTSL